MIDRSVLHFRPGGQVDLAAATVTVGLLAFVALGATGPLRILLALGFVTFVPGWALLGLTDLMPGPSRVALAVAVSLAGCTASALGMAWLHAWHPFTLFYAVAAVSLLTLMWNLVRPPAALLPAAVLPAALSQPEPEAPAPPVTSEPAQPRRLTLRSEDLRLTHLTVRAGYSSQSFTPHELVEFFAAIHQRHPFDSFNPDADGGAVMDAQGCRRLQITPEWVEYSEVGGADFSEAKQHAVDLFGEAQQRLGLRAMAGATCRLRARLDAGGDPAMSPLFAQPAGTEAGLLALLGSPEPVSVVLQFSGESGEPRQTWQLALAQDGGHALLVDLTTGFNLSDDAFSRQLEKTYQFLTGNVMCFVAAIVGSTPGDPSMT